MNRKTLVFIVFAVILFTVFFVAGKVKRKSNPSINLSGLTLKDLSGNEITLGHFANKPLLVNFWGTWCGPCLKELEAFETVQKKYGGQMNFMMVSDEALDKIQKFQQRNNYPFFFAHSQKRFDDLGIASVPVTCIFDARGNLFKTKIGALGKEELILLIENMQ